MRISTDMKVGDKVFVEQAWEDETGFYHDEIATVVDISIDGLMELKFERDDITAWLRGSEYRVEDYEPISML
jgi:hypothetical protein